MDPPSSVCSLKRKRESKDATGRLIGTNLADVFYGDAVIVLRRPQDYLTMIKRLVHLTKLNSLEGSGYDCNDEEATNITGKLYELTRLKTELEEVRDRDDPNNPTTTVVLRHPQDNDSRIKSLKHFTETKSLEVSGECMGDEGAAAIAESLSGLTTLYVYNQNIIDGVEDIAKGLPRLTRLDLSKNRIGIDGAVDISKHLIKLKWLNVDSNDIGDEGAVAIATRLTSLTTLNVSYNCIEKKGAAAIAAGLRRLTDLNASHNTIGKEGAAAMAYAGLPSLTTLDVTYNNIGDEGAAALAMGMSSLKLNTLNVSNNSIGQKGAAAIATRLTSLTTLDVSNNSIGQEGAAAIAAGLPRLTTLDVHGNCFL